MMTCQQAQNLMNDLHDNVLSEREKARLTTHLDGCPNCKNDYEALVATVRLVRTLPVPDGQPSQDRVMRNFRHAVGSPEFAPQRAGWRIPFVPLGMAAAAVAGLTMLLILPTMNPPQEDIPGSPVAVTALPTTTELDHMAEMHSARSTQELAPNVELHQEARADAVTRIATLTEDDSL